MNHCRTCGSSVSVFYSRSLKQWICSVCADERIERNEQEIASNAHTISRLRLQLKQRDNQPTLFGG